MSLSGTKWQKMTSLHFSTKFQESRKVQLMTITLQTLHEQGEVDLELGIKFLNYKII